MRFIDPACGHPRGVLGRLGGRVMARGNAEQERWAVTQAAHGPGESVLVLGHGPGVGVSLAARGGGALGGRVVGMDPSEAMRTYFGGVAVHLRARRGNSPAVERSARRT